MAVNVRLVVNLGGEGQGSGGGFEVCGAAGELWWSISCPSADLMNVGFVINH